VQNVTNPLNTYRFLNFPYSSSTFPSNNALSSYSSTVRRPNSNRVSDPNAVNTVLRSQAPGQAQQLYTIFTRATAYNNMATQSSSGPSFEGPHGWLHVTVGGNGHMTDVGYSGFDPIFYLHHTNVDRLSVMWQAIYPNAWMAAATEGTGTWTLVRGQTLNSRTPLLPFYRADGSTPWTSDSSRYTRNLGYSYPDVKDWLYSASDLATTVTRRVNTLYNLRGSSRKRSLDNRAPKRPTREWSIQISAPNNALQGQSYSVILFLGPKPADPFAWVPESIGSMFVLAQPTPGSSDPSQSALPAQTEVVITEFLQAKGIDTTDVKATKKYIDNNLVWGVQNADGAIIPNEQFKGLKLLVEDDIVKLPENKGQFPKYSDKTQHPDVTPVTPVNPV
jgi:tyrosinase